MQSTARCILLLLAAAWAPRAVAAESSIRCAGGIVQAGDAKVELLAKCGTPALKETSTEGRGLVEVLDGEPSGAASTGGERWTYNFGPGRFLQVVTLDLGRVVRSSGAGTATSRSGCASGAAARRRRSTPATGSSTSSRAAARRWRASSGARSGSPRCSPPPGAQPSFARVDVETWSYDLGPNRFLVVVTLEGGRVVRVERGSWGAGR